MGGQGGEHGEYRPDIDGLRAVAVLLVLLYHLDVGFTKGGFVGVDVFFVISGYLITRIVSKEVGTGSFSLLRFYERRVRRLFPALFAVLTFSAIGSTLLLFPGELAYFGRTLMAAIFFTANLQFYNGAGYFSETLETVPLLHMWSLAVEEQFYLLYPLALLLLLQRTTWTRTGLVFSVAAFLSLALSVFLVRHDRSAAFFLLPPRAWELLVGCILALGVLPPLTGRRARQGASLLGLILILVAGGAFNKNVTFPGWAAMAPCLGAALIIHAGSATDIPDTPVGRLLSSRLLTFVGLISYSLYLWHWPLIVFFKSQFGLPSHPEQVLLATASIAIAVLSWRYVESPFRRRALLAKRKSLFSAAAIASASAASLATILVATNGMSHRYPENVRRLSTFKYDPSGPMRDGTCFISRSFSDRPSIDGACLQLDMSRKNVLLVGDSHAAHFWSGLSTVFKDVNFLQATASGCSPVVDGGGSTRCRSVVDAAYSDFIPRQKLDAVIIAANWATRDLPGVLRTVADIQKHVDKVYVFGPIVRYDAMLPRLLARSEWLHDPTLIDQARRPGTRAMDRLFADAIRSTGARYVSIYDILCDESEGCTTRDEQGDPIQFDFHHLTKGGSILVARGLKDRGVLQ
jgi:peptidoglycan/LPS O-acetylase OafA/YrhL